MVKLIGCAVFLSGVAGSLNLWLCQERALIRRLQKWIDFLNATEYAMQIEHVNMTSYMESAAVDEPVLLATIRDTGALLRRQMVPFGEDAWDNACEKHKREWDVGEEAWRLILSCRYVFFGRNLAENIEKSKEIRRRLTELLEEERRQFAQRKKVYIPVGMLGSCMFLLIFL